MLKSQFFQHQQRPLIFGHRGVVTEHQENTLAGFQKAIALGIDGIELDTVLTRDGQLVVFHDLYTKRLTGFSGNITEMTWQEIQRLRLKDTCKIGKKNIYYPRPEPIPLLEEVLEQTRGKIIVNLEIKAPKIAFHQHQTGIAVANLIKRLNLEQQVFVTSFSLWSLIWLKLTHTAIESGILYSPMTTRNPFIHKSLQTTCMETILDASLVSLHLKLLKPDRIKHLHQQGLAIGAWTIFPRQNTVNIASQEQQDLQLLQRLTQGQIDFLITDDPQRLQQLIALDLQY